jgi:hypothetical protein
VKFKLDENLPASSASALIGSGHDVDSLIDEGLAGAPDTDVVAAATAAARVLISLDRGLGDIRMYPPGTQAGRRLVNGDSVEIASARTRRTSTLPRL